MKFKLPLALLIGMAAFTAKAQLVVGTTTPIDASAILQAVSTSKGFLPPLLTNTQMNAITNPATGLVVFNTTLLSLMMNIGTSSSPNWTNGASTLYNADGTLLANRTVWQSGNYLQFTGTGQIYFNSGAVNFSSVTTFNNNANFNSPATFGNAAIFNGYAQFNAVLMGSGAEIQGIGIGIRSDGGINIGQNNNNNKVAIGYHAGANNNGAQNNFVGYRAGESNTSGYHNSFEGYLAGQNTTSGYQNTFFGSQAGLANGSGNNNVYVGENAGYRNTTGFSNVVIGSLAGGRMGGSFANTYVGYYTASNDVNSYENTALGYSAGPAFDGQFNSTSIGYSASTNSNNQIQLGNSDISSFRCQVGLQITSDARFKYQVKENVPGLAFIQKLRPVSYRFDNKKLAQYQKDGIEKPGFNEDATAPIQTGFLAQEVEKLVQELGVTFDAVHAPVNAKDHYSLSYAQFVMPLVKGMQEQQAIIEKLMAELNNVKTRLQKLEQK